MTQIPKVLQFKMAGKFPTLKSMGFAVEYFPNYLHDTLRMHSVDVVLMTVIIRGRGIHVMENHTFKETSGSVGITHYGQRHDVLATGRGLDIYNVYLDLQRHPLPNLPSAFDNVLPAILPLHPSLLNELNRSVHFRIDDPQKLAQPLACIAREIQQKKAGYEEMARSAFKMFLIECCRAAASNGWTHSPSSHAIFPEWVEKIRQRLDEEYAENQNLKAMAKQANVSVGYLCRTFRSYAGKTIFQYLIERRIEASMLRLRNSDEKILNIALKCGFQDLAYFNRTFRKIVKKTPSAYRKRTRAR